MDTNRHLVSIVLCTFNGEKFLKEQLDSLISQTYPNLEIIIVDDDSTDDTRKILNSYASKHPEIKLYFNERNLGFNKNFEKAISLSTGEYISICDQDDFWFPEKIEKLVKAIGVNWAVFSNSEYVDFKKKSMNVNLLRSLLPIKNYQSILMENFFTGHTSLLRRGSIEYILPIPQNGFYDWWIGFVCLYHKKLVFHNEVLTLYRVHQNSVIQGKQKSKDNRSLKDVDGHLQNFMSYKNLGIEDKKAISIIKNKLSTKGIFNPLWFEFLTNYPHFFPKRIHQNFLSKINFLRKFFTREAGAS